MSERSTEGLRERKRRETHQRIIDSALRLFLAYGYEGTTLDAIAAEASISRRTFFSYFESKDDIIMAWQHARWAGMFADLLSTSPDIRPLDAVRDVLVKQASGYTNEEMLAIDKLMRSSTSLLARKQAFYAGQEQKLFETLCEVWRQPERRTALRMVAVVSLGALRLAIQDWYAQADRRKPVTGFLCEAFDSMKSEL